MQHFPIYDTEALPIQNINSGNIDYGPSIMLLSERHRGVSLRFPEARGVEARGCQIILIMRNPNPLWNTKQRWVPYSIISVLRR